jgi:hypothetical protein
MTTFPSITPSGVRTFTPGARPSTQLRSMGGSSSLIQHSDGIIDQRVSLSFIGLTEAEMLSVRTHYINCRGSFFGFDLPADIWSGSASTYTPVGYQWHYVSNPLIDDAPCGRYSVTMELEMLPGVITSISVPAATVTILMDAPTISADLTLVVPAATVAIAPRVPLVITSA